MSTDGSQSDRQTDGHRIKPIYPPNLRLGGGGYIIINVLRLLIMMYSIHCSTPKRSNYKSTDEPNYAVDFDM